MGDDVVHQERAQKKMNRFGRKKNNVSSFRCALSEVLGG